MTWATLGLDSARELVDLKHARAESQLRGAVAVHNILQRERVAYLADEVGLGKTYVALTVMALMRHYQPDLRVLVIAPRGNIQRKWTNDWRTFVARNWQATDLRVKGVTGAPQRPMVFAERLVDLVHDSATHPDADLFARLTSFSFAAVGDHAAIQTRVRRVLPWLEAKDFPTDERELRDFVAQAYNAALPTYDLVIIDEAHNLGGGVTIKDGKVGGGALRNAVLAQVLGHPDVTPHRRFKSTYCPLADRVLLLSATPVEESFDKLWRQLYLVGKHVPPGGSDFESLKDDERAAEEASRVLVRRINTVEINGSRYTKSQYRRVWQGGGVGAYDEPLAVGSLRQRLTVALVQKKVSDLIGTRFNNQFQMGMLASFESFGETALKPPKAAAQAGGASEEDAPVSGTFDGDQSEDPVERLGIDTGAVNALSRDHFETFGAEMAHPKMDALVDDLSQAWNTGEKTLVFVRRVASVAEIKRKVDETFDRWLLGRLEAEVPDPAWRRIDEARRAYETRRAAEGRNTTGPSDGADDVGGSDTFFAWFFRGKGPTLPPVGSIGDPMETGASLAERLGAASGAASTFFAEHYLADVLGCSPTVALDRLADAVGRDVASAVMEIDERARHHLPQSAGRRHTFDAVQIGALELLRDELPADEPLAETVAALLSEMQVARGDRRTLAFDVRQLLKTPTFFTRLLRHRELTAQLLPSALAGARNPQWAREHYLRTSLLAAGIRLGQPLIDLYVTFLNTTGSGAATDNEDINRTVDAFLDLLERQRSGAPATGAYVELEQVARDFDLVCSLNLPNTSREGFVLAGAGRECGTLLGKQQPTVGMAGRVNETAVRQFRMPGYPYVLVCTDVLQEGVDLHTYCDRVVHYGVAWTASAMEQRAGRVDRINSLAERRFVRLDEARTSLAGPDKIQVLLPYLSETVERVQARTVLRRMQTFVDLMHHGADGVTDERRLDLTAEMQKGDGDLPGSDEPMISAFNERESDLQGRSRGSRVTGDLVNEWWQRLICLAQSDELAACFVGDGGRDRPRLAVYGSRTVGDRVQPFSLHLLSRDSMPVVSARTPVARHPDVQGGSEALADELSGVLDRVIVAEHAATREYDIAIAGDVILGDPAHDGARVATLVRRITDRADDVEQALTQRDLRLQDVATTLQTDVRS